MIAGRQPLYLRLGQNGRQELRGDLALQQGERRPPVIAGNGTEVRNGIAAAVTRRVPGDQLRDAPGRRRRRVEAEGDLRRETSMNIKRLMTEINSLPRLQMNYVSDCS